MVQFTCTKCIVSDAQRTLVLTSEPSLSPGPLCERLVRFTCTGTELPFVLNWVLNGSILAAYSFSSTHTYPFPLAPEPPDSSFPPGVAVNVTSAARNPNVATSIDITTILDASDVSVLNLSSLRCEDSIQLIMSNEINIEVDFRGECISLCMSNNIAQNAPVQNTIVFISWEDKLRREGGPAPALAIYGCSYKYLARYI